jgi:hypothetical protein
MRISLNERAAHQLQMIMNATGYTNPTHCIQTMLTQVNSKLQLVKEKRKPQASD